MKQYIKNKSYDTATATPIGSYEYGAAADLDHRRETLYRKRTGEYFLHGEGGAMSRHAVMSGANSWSGGEKISPLTADQAREWAQEHLDTATYDSEFGEIVDDGTSESVLLCLNAALIERSRRAQSSLGIGSLSAFVEQALEAYLGD